MSHRANGLNDIFENNVEIKKGQVLETPINDPDIANKKYVDDAINVVNLTAQDDGTYITILSNGIKLFRIVKATKQIQIPTGIDTDINL